MKKQNNPSIKAHLLRGALYLLLLSVGTLLAFFHPEAPANVSHRTLTFAERVSYQRAIEEVYWRHRIWPRPDPKPLLDAVMPQAQLEKKVADYLRNSQVLENYYQQPITAEQLQAEMDRMAKHTRQPEVLHKLFEALGNDAFVVAECLAKPVLAERLVVDLSAQDNTGRFESARSKELRNVSMTRTVASAAYTLPRIGEGNPPCTDDSWTATSIINAPDGRQVHTVVWTGSEMIIWGGVSPSGYLNTGGRYNPSTDSWTATSTANAPTARYVHTAVWSGSEMIVWGGSNGSDLNTGSRYNPGTDSWTATSTTGAPVGRIYHTAVWTGSEMIVWGGSNGSDLNTGGRYDPSTDTWTATSISNAPAARYLHTAAWTGSEMTVWGGRNGNSFLNTGGRYNPSTDNWTATSTIGAPDARWEHTAIWTGTEMIVWGGTNDSTGGRYNPGTDSWTATSSINAPDGRAFHTAVWTESEMIVWGGYHDSSYVNTGGRYNPSTDSWRATSTTNAPDGRAFHTAVWTGGEMIVWGGGADITYLNTGGTYCAAAPSPTPTPTPTPMGCSVTSPACGTIVHTQPTDFIIDLSDPVDPAAVQPSDFTVNGSPADGDIIINGNLTIIFHFNTSPVVQGQNTMHIPACAFNCGNGCVQEFTCTFTYQAPTPTPTLTPRPTPTPRPRPSARPRPTP
jgi:N-acetylneuraminic acid mutarotase